LDAIALGKFPALVDIVWAMANGVTQPSNFVLGDCIGFGEDAGDVPRDLISDSQDSDVGLGPTEVTGEAPVAPVELLRDIGDGFVFGDMQSNARPQSRE